MLDDRVALITGGTGALGTTVCRVFLQSGATVVATCEAGADLSRFQAQFSNEELDRLTCMEVDILDEASVESLVRSVHETFGRIDILINLVGGYLGNVAFHDTKTAEFDRMVDLNLRSAFYCCRAVLPGMLERNYGRIVTISSLGAVEIAANSAVYAVSKAGLKTLTEAIARDVRDANITANTVLPAMLDTPANRRAMPGENFEKWVTPEGAAYLLRFLASEHAADVTGAAIPITGRM